MKTGLTGMLKQFTERTYIKLITHVSGVPTWQEFLSKVGIWLKWMEIGNSS